jgi:ribonucleoside-triphosphate reductase
MNVYQQIIYKSRYAKWIDALGRREDYSETVNRYWSHMKSKAFEHGLVLAPDIEQKIVSKLLTADVLPSMRGYMSAGAALGRDEGAIFNCAFIGVDSVEAFGEILFTLMLGTGVGFSVESAYINKLPAIPVIGENKESFIVEDSKEGWADTIKFVISRLYLGVIPEIFYHNIRPKGAKLKVFGGRASGPDPLIDLVNFTKKVFLGAQGRKLKSIEVHDIVCKIAACVVSGGVRRSAMISISDLADIEMRDAKSGNWWETNVQRALANNSAAYNERPTIEQFWQEWDALAKSGSGERGIFNRAAAVRKAESIGRKLSNLFGTNPCAEISINSRQFCNLTSISIRATDTEESLIEKVEVATILGTIQSLFDGYRYISNGWAENQERERLLGVSLSGIVDNPLTNGTEPGVTQSLLINMRAKAREVNAEYAKKLNINTSAAITTVKPEGTTSQMTGCSSGIHPAYSRYYIRRVRMDDKDPISQFLIDQGIPYEVDTYNPNAYVFEFPIKTAETAIQRLEMNAIDQLELYKLYQRHWAEHNVSNTVYVKQEEWRDVGQWVWDNFDEISGVSFLPFDNGTYVQAPYEEIEAEEYQKRLSKMPESIDWTILPYYEIEDGTTGVQQLACVSGECEIPSLPSK